MAQNDRNAVEVHVTNAVNAVLGPGWRPVETREAPQEFGITGWAVDLRNEKTGERVTVTLEVESARR